MLEEARAGWPSHVSPSLETEVALDRSEVAERMSGNLCRCAAYTGIVEAILETAEREAEHETPEAAE